MGYSKRTGWSRAKILARGGLAAMVVVTCSLAGCGGDDDDGDGASCGFTACGGDLEGTWKFVDGCVQTLPSFDEPECAGAFEDVELDATGTVGFGSDGMVDYAFALTWSTRMVISASCANASGLPAPSDVGCAALEPLLWLGSEGDIDTANCDFVGEVCDCTALATASFQAELPYTVGDDEYVVDGNPSEYCVSGNELRVLVVDETDDSRSVLTLTRQ